MDLASKLVSDASAHTDEVMAELLSWPGVGAYHAYDTMRALRAVLGLRFAQDRKAAASMSKNVDMLQSMLSLTDMASLMQKHLRGNAPVADPGDAALVTCECKKALTRLGLLLPKKKYSAAELRNLQH